MLPRSAASVHFDVVLPPPPLESVALPIILNAPMETLVVRVAEINENYHHSSLT